MAGAATSPTKNSADATDSLLKLGNTVKRKSSRCWSVTQKFCVICTIIITGLILLAFFGIFVGFPLVFMWSIDLQRSLLFVPYITSLEQFGKISEHVEGARNFYVTVNETENITLGVWQLLPEALINESKSENFSYSEALTREDYPILIHFHGNSGNRIYNLDAYLELRKYFHILAFDYRSYGDSTEAELTEEGMVQDSVQFYKWVRNQTNADIYLWGHSLGTSIATHATAKLWDNDIVPTGLILEAPYTSMRDELMYYPPSKVLNWLPWFNITILSSLEKNGFRFETIKNILKVDCPVLILHAEDDAIIPYFLGEKLARVAQERRDTNFQGNITFHLFPAKFGYSHWTIYKAPELPQYIREYMDICQAFNKTKN